MNPNGSFLPWLCRLLCLLLVLILLFAASGCGKLPDPVIESGSDSAVRPQTDAPALTTEAQISSVVSEPEPSASTETEPAVPSEPLCMEEVIQRYEAYPLDYSPVEREAERPISPVPAPRFSLGPDGIWRSAESGDGPAVLMLTGDLLCQTRQQEAAKTESGYDFRGSFHYVQPVFAEADLVIGNLEGTLSEQAPYMAEQPEVEGKPHLNAPASYLEALRAAGFDAVVMSNNHNCDAGVRGIFDTLDRVEEYGMIHTGTFRSREDPRFILVEIKGIRFGLMSYATFFNKKDAHLTAEGVSTLLNRYDPETAARDAAAAREAGAEYLLVYIHWGKEYVNTPTDKQLRIARELADAGYDFIIGSHPHALQPYDTVTSADGRSVPVLYSMGNFVSHQMKTVTKDTLILRLAFDRDDAGKAVLTDRGYIPCRVFKSFGEFDYAVIPLTKPYNQGLKSGYFQPALERISELIGPELPLLGER